jgi:hypothetical protein
MLGRVNVYPRDDPWDIWHYPSNKYGKTAPTTNVGHGVRKLSKITKAMHNISKGITGSAAKTPKHQNMGAVAERINY